MKIRDSLLSTILISFVKEVDSRKLLAIINSENPNRNASKTEVIYRCSLLKNNKIRSPIKIQAVKIPCSQDIEIIPIKNIAIIIFNITQIVPFPLIQQNTTARKALQQQIRVLLEFDESKLNTLLYEIRTLDYSYFSENLIVQSSDWLDYRIDVLLHFHHPNLFTSLQLRKHRQHPPVTESLLGEQRNLPL